MADKKLNEVSQLTDFDYALVVKGNDVAKVTKQQLATLLGELIGINDTWLRYRGNITTADQLDSIRISGLYIATSTVIPNVIWTGQFMVGFNKDGTVGFQIYINDNATTVKMRVFWWSKWFDWVRITTT